MCYLNLNLSLILAKNGLEVSVFSVLGHREFEIKACPGIPGSLDSQWHPYCDDGGTLNFKACGSSFEMLHQQWCTSWLARI